MRRRPRRRQAQNLVISDAQLPILVIGASGCGEYISPAESLQALVFTEGRLYLTKGEFSVFSVWVESQVFSDEPLHEVWLSPAFKAFLRTPGSGETMPQGDLGGSFARRKASDRNEYVPQEELCDLYQMLSLFRAVFLLPSHAREAACGLLPNWEGTLAELLESATALVSA